MSSFISKGSSSRWRVFRVHVFHNVYQLNLLRLKICRFYFIEFILYEIKKHVLRLSSMHTCPLYTMYARSSSMPNISSIRQVFLLTFLNMLLLFLPFNWIIFPWNDIQTFINECLINTQALIIIINKQTQAILIVVFILAILKYQNKNKTFDGKFRWRCPKSNANFFLRLSFFLVSYTIFFLPPSRKAKKISIQLVHGCWPSSCSLCAARLYSKLSNLFASRNCNFHKPRIITVKILN